ncbi:MAG: spore coat protein [Syntrophomonadaceae bacterium]|nr:spore coat protein [Syntrophomonadaceae bacterium]
MLQLTQKERMLLQDQQKHEQICIEKYTNYANQAQDPQLKQLFQSYAQQEQSHLDTINQLLNGQIPNLNQQGQNQAQSPSGQGNQANPTSMSQNPSVMQGAMGSESDAALCNDMLMTEKYVSNAYDTAIFEFTDANVRQVLNHIQKEEQQHGEGIFNYMNSNGMYNPQ